MRLCSFLTLSLLLLSWGEIRAKAEEEDWKHQYVLFLMEGLDPTSGLTHRWTPFLAMATGNGNGVKAADMRIDDYKFSWLTHLYAATRIEYGSSDLAPIEQGYRGLLEVLSETYGYSVAVFSDYKKALPEGVRTRYQVIDVPRDGSFVKEVAFERLPHTSRRVVLVHMGGAFGTTKAFGYGSENYGAQLACLDWQIETIATRLASDFHGDSTFAVLSNHGGQGSPYKRGENELHTSLVRVPFGAWGSGIGKCGTCEASETETMQIAHTLLEAGGLDAPDYWKYKLVPEFVSDDADLAQAAAWHSPSHYPGGICPVPWDYDSASVRVYNWVMAAAVLVLMTASAKLIFPHAMKNFLSLPEIRKRTRGV